MWRSPPFGIWERNAVSWSGLAFAALKARMARCSCAVATGWRTRAALFAGGCADAAIARQRRSTAERLGVGRSIGRPYDFDMRKDSASRGRLAESREIAILSLRLRYWFPAGGMLL